MVFSEGPKGGSLLEPHAGIVWCLEVLHSFTGHAKAAGSRAVEAAAGHTD